MNKTILLKDIKLLLRDLKIQIFFGLLVVLFLLAAVSGASSYKANVEVYQNRFNAHQDKKFSETDYICMDLVSNTGRITVIDKPSPALLFSSYENYPNIVRSRVGYYIPEFDFYATNTRNAFSLNWYFILGILCGFLMLIMSFESVSKEKIAGTLRLLSIYGMKRQSLLWYKFFSYIILYLIITIIPAILSLLLFFALTGTWSGLVVCQFALMIIFSIPFASFFIFLGILISMNKNYRNNIIMVVFFWLLFVIIIPQSANIFGKIISPTLTSAEYRNKMYQACRVVEDEWLGKHGVAAAGNGSLENGIRAGYVNARDEAQFLSRQAEQEDYKKQSNTIQLIANLSPFNQFEKISEVIFDKGDYLFSHAETTVNNTIPTVRNLLTEQDKED
ncbi:MAG: ABC transporter permease, partial [Candidatus Cloacimonetes bacterium]|nr:ABC transporter permease [Candidatus Cloacimonadota bacterium]